MQLELQQIDENLIKSDSGNLPANFVAVAVLINDTNIAQHSGLIIGVDGVYYLFHYTGTEILFDDIIKNEWYYHKELSIIPSDLSEHFLSHCELIKRDSNIEYGFIFGGSYYINGIYFSESGLPEFSTCVGFCINAITGYLFDIIQYFEINDWDSIPVDSSPRFNHFFQEALKKYTDLDIEKYKTHHKRIRPDEYTASAYFGESFLPIRKQAIDSIIEDVRNVISKKKSLTIK